MTTSYVGKSVKRLEDARLLTGQALFVDDVHLPNMLEVAFLRSSYAHARIRKVDTSAALKRKGVVAIYTAKDLGEYWQPGPLLVSPPPIKRLTFHARTQVALAKDKVRYVGEPIVAVVAENRYIAEDALNDIVVDFEPLPAVVDLEKALLPNTALIHEDLPSNLAAHVIQEKGNYFSIKDKADVIIKRDLSYDHGAAVAMENRAIVADWNAREQQMTVWDTTQAPIPIMNGLAKMLGLSETQVRVIAPFLGGAFGPKVMMFYSEEMLIPWISKKIGRPVKWIEDRQENFLATTHERGQTHHAEMALSKEGKILGIHDVFLHDTGAYDPYGLTVPINSQCTLLGPYHVPNYYSEFSVIFTNKMIVTPYRGAGRPQGVFVMERLLDLAAKQLHLTPAEIRSRNFILPEQFPYKNEIIYQDFAPLVYDSGNYAPSMEKAIELIDYKKFVEEEQPKLRAEGRSVGIGVVSYVEGTGIGPYEGAKVTVGATGKVSVATGVGTQGQSHFTTFAQIVADVLKVDIHDVTLVTGDTFKMNWGCGTFASRGMVVAGNACYAAAMSVREKILKLASEVLESPIENLELAESKVSVKGMPEKKITLGELAVKANPLRGAVKPGTVPGLEATAYFGPATGATSNGVHAAILEVNPKTLRVDILKYVVVHDCGKIVNPMVVEGQIHGGVAQGIGNAYYEQIVYDKKGQLLTASLMDYLLPTSYDVPRKIITGHVETPSPLNPLGVKGTGEAGTIPTASLFVQALENALDNPKLEIREIPMSPNRLFELMKEAL
ncbi:MAG: xanthine dehydrogenase family protein molybdopterin-binding subunit [Candidatus Brocadiae bacterium]|nr:xanthine dehydrogenase family protein molybdopterin-binding subunit [Candidatus Brocadiia bacterium]